MLHNAVAAEELDRMRAEDQHVKQMQALLTTDLAALQAWAQQAAAGAT